MLSWRRMETPGGRGIVFWDFHGTLGFREGDWSGALSAILKRDGSYCFPKEAISAQLRRGFPWHTPEIPHARLFRGLSWWDYVNSVVEAALLALGVDQRKASELAVQTRGEYLDIVHWGLYPDVLDTLSIVLTAGYRNYVLSNHVPELSQIVHGLGLGTVIQEVLTSGALGYEKPHPRIFEMAREAAGDGGPYYMVGDSLDADARAGDACGFRGILVRSANTSGFARYSGDLPGVLPLLTQE